MEMTDSVAKCSLRSVCVYLMVLSAISLSCPANICAGQQDSHHIEIQAASTGFQPSNEQSITVPSATESIVVKSGNPYSVVLQSKDVKKLVLLPPELVQVTMVRLFASKMLIIAGAVNGDADVVIVLDVHSGVVVDKILCYSPSISPNGRYTAFIKFYPTHGISSAEDHYMLYDASLTPSENRPTNISSHPSAVGRTVYPRDIGNMPGDNVDIEGRPLHRWASDSFFWTAGSDMFVFMDSFQKEYVVVVARVDAVSKVWTALVPSQLYCKGLGDSCSERLSRVDFNHLGAGDMVLGLRGVEGTPSREVQVLVNHVGTPLMDTTEYQSQHTENR